MDRQIIIKISQRVLALTVFIVAVVALSGCASTPPKYQDNLCHIFDEKDDWYEAAYKAQRRWGSPIPVMMAMMHQESRFVSKAKPPRSKILWVIPGPRPSSSYGYAQAKDETWDWYKDKSGNWGADRDEFADAIDFVGWYNQQTAKQSGVAAHDTYRLYLAYHEGHGGFKRGSFNGKAWLKKVAKKVSTRAQRYATQLKQCESRLDKGAWWWPF